MEGLFHSSENLFTAFDGQLFKGSSSVLARIIYNLWRSKYATRFERNMSHMTSKTDKTSIMCLID